MTGAAPGNGVPALDIRGVSAAYGKIEVLHDVSFTVDPSSVTVLLGPNGAGKSTTLKVVSGRLHSTAGSVSVNGKDVTRRPSEYVTKLGVCNIPEGRGVFPNLTVSENLRMWTYRSRRLKRSTVEERAFERFPRLAERRRQLAGTLSGGEQQMLSMSRALSTEPKLLLLDEISMGLAPIIVTELYELVAQLAKQGIAILIVEQFARTALSIADKAAIMTQGRIEAIGPPADVGEAALSIYLGAER